MPALIKGLRNLKTMTNRVSKIQSPHDALVNAAALHREKQRHLQELTILQQRLKEVYQRLDEINEKQNQLAEAFDIPSQSGVTTPRCMTGPRAIPMSHGFKIKY